jgi:hypothetical protein
MGEERAQDPRDAANETRKPQPYPAVDQTDGVHGETRSFSAAARQACDVTPVSTTEGRLGPGGDPAEGKDEE